VHEDTSLEKQGNMDKWARPAVARCVSRRTGRRSKQDVSEPETLGGTSTGGINHDHKETAQKGEIYRISKRE